MGTTQSKSIIEGREEVEESYVKRARQWLFFTFEKWEKVSTEHIGNDIVIITDRPIRNILLNGKKVYQITEE